MARSVFHLPALLAVAVLAAGCAGGDMPSLMSTASVAPAAEDVAPKRESRVSAECVTLANQIQALRSDGTIDRLEKSAAGPGANVQVKRTAVAKQAELNKANADFQTRCAPRIPTSTTAAVSPASAPAATVAAAAAPATAKAAAKAAVPSGVTVATPKVN
jgi:hypothetical protein